MKILVTGKDGQLGWELTRTLQTHGEVIAVGAYSGGSCTAILIDRARQFWGKMHAYSD